MNGDLISLKKTLSPQDLEILRTEVERQRKSSVVAYLLWFFLSWLAMHKFYIGKVKQGILYLAVPWLAVIIAIAGGVIAGQAPGAPADSTATGAGITVLVIAGLAFLASVIWWLVDLFTLHRQVERANEQIEREIIEQLRRR